MKDLKELIAMCNDIIVDMCDKRDFGKCKRFIVQTLYWIIASPIIAVGWIACLAIDILSYV